MPDTLTATRFALLPEAEVRAWLGTWGFDEDVPGPGIGSGWEPATDDYDGSDIVNLLYEATNEHVLLRPPGTELFFVLDNDTDDGSYLWLVDTAKERPDLPAAQVRLASHFQEMRKIGARGAKGADAAFTILTEAVETANGLLDDLDAWSAA